jgi:hypothetical protein
MKKKPGRSSTTSGASARASSFVAVVSGVRGWRIESSTLFFCLPNVSFNLLESVGVMRAVSCCMAHVRVASTRSANGVVACREFVERRERPIRALIAGRGKRCKALMVRTCGQNRSLFWQAAQKVGFLTRPTLARRDAPSPKQGRSE